MLLSLFFHKIIIIPTGIYIIHSKLNAHNTLSHSAPHTLHSILPSLPLCPYTITCIHTLDHNSCALILASMYAWRERVWKSRLHLSLAFGITSSYNGITVHLYFAVSILYNYYYYTPLLAQSLKLILYTHSTSNNA